VQLPYSVAELVAATHELLAANGLADCYVRPIAFYGYGTLGVPPRENPVYVAILSWPWGAYLGDAAAEHGIRVKVSSWRRVGPNTIPHAAKATGVYLNSMLAVGEANRAGYDEAILLTDEGTVGDGSGENVFAVRGAVLSTPDLSASILPGIIRDTVVTIARDLGYEVCERALIRTDLYAADELFLSGTAAEVTPIRSVDDVELGPPGPVARAIRDGFLARRDRPHHALPGLAGARAGPHRVEAGSIRPALTRGEDPAPPPAP
jgi:branched-chain amino acid aminotransferase